MRRGEVWWANLPGPRGSEAGFRRPVVVVQSDAFNRSRLNTVMVVPLTSNARLAGAPGNVLLPARETGLPRSSVVNPAQVLALDKRFFETRVRALSAARIATVDDGLRLALDL